MTEGAARRPGSPLRERQSPPHPAVLEDTPTLPKERSEAASPDDPGHYMRLKVTIP